MVDNKLIAFTWRERIQFLYSVEGNRMVLQRRLPLSTSTGDGRRSGREAGGVCE